MSKKAKLDFTQIAFQVGQKAAHLEPPAEKPEPFPPKAAARWKKQLD